MRKTAVFRRWKRVKFSLTSNRGCFGGCSFCALTFPSGTESCRREVTSLWWRKRKRSQRIRHFKGYIHDVGGPTANFRHPSCEKQLKSGVLQEPPVSVSEALQQSQRRSQRLCQTAPQTAQHPESEKSIHSFGNPF